MSKVSLITKNYAKALFLVAVKQNLADKVAADLDIFKKNFSSNFACELKNPVISKNDLAKIIVEISEKLNLGKEVGNLVLTLAINRRLELFLEVYGEFQTLLKQQKNILEVELVLAKKAQMTQIANIKNLIEKKYPNKIIEIKESIKEEILGGMQVKIGSRVIDASLKNQLKNISKECFAAIN